MLLADGGYAQTASGYVITILLSVVIIGGGAALRVLLNSSREWHDDASIRFDKIEKNQENIQVSLNSAVIDIAVLKSRDSNYVK